MTRWTDALPRVVLLCALAAGCTSGTAATHRALTAGAEPLRSHFNRDIGRARIVLLAAPT